ncbi:hypothetical protein BGW39_001981 [Mortierella sp. 14UC]|nr:hypothetical protein BGW39_001981 [Mortierella sp. 14UC]
MILRTLTPHDFSQCILVCQVFAKIFTPILWHTISLRRDDQHALFAYSPEVLAALVRNAPYVQVVQNLASYASDHLHPHLMFAERQQQQQGSDSKAVTTATAATPTKDWLRYNGMFLMRRHYFVDRIYHQRQLNEYHQRRVAQHQQHEFWKQAGDPSYVAMKLKEAEEKLAQLEGECLVQEKKFPTLEMGLGPALVEQDLVLLRDKIRQTKEEMDLFRVKASTVATGLPSPLTDAGVLAAGTRVDNINNPAGALGLPPFCVDYEERDEQILELFLGRFPQIQTLMTTSIPFLRGGVFKKVVGLEGLRSLSLTVFHSSLRKQVSNVHTLLTACPPNLEILRLSFMEKDDTAVDMPVNLAVRSMRFGNSDSTATSTAEQVLTTTSSSSRLTMITDTNTNISAKEDEDEMSLDLVQVSIKRSGPLRSLRRLFIEGYLGDPPVAVEDNNTTDPATAVEDSATTTGPSADSQTWVAFLERCPNLLTLSLGNCSVKILPEVGHALKLHCPLVEDFAIGFKYFLGTPFYELIDPNLATLLSSLSSGLKRLRIDTLFLEPNSQVLRVVQHRFASTLTEISLNDCKYTRHRFMEESPPIFSLLHSFRRLESLDLVPSGEIFHSNEHSLGVTRFVSEVFSRPWMCRETLRVLRINIDSVMRRPTSYSSTKEEDMENSRLVQRRACQFFGSFPALEELSLGVLMSSSWERREHDGLTPTSAQDYELGPVYGAFKFVGVQATCLALSLTHGLELMGGLKRLRVFNVARLDHMIETEEVEFMLEQWPR